MLIEFRVSNYRSIAEEQVISLIPATQQKDYPENIITIGKYQSLNAIALYGANASGKSNLLKALELIDKLLYMSARSNSTTKLPYFPFLLKEGYENKPTKFEIIFLIDENRYTYNIEYDRDAIIAETLYRKKQSREVLLFARKGDVIDVSSGFKGAAKLIDAAIEATRENSLFLSACDTFNVKEAKDIFHWFDKLIYINGLYTQREEFATVNLWEDNKYKESIKNYLSLLELGFHDLDVKTEEFDADKLPESLDERTRNLLKQQLLGKKGFKTVTTHAIYDANGQKTQATHTWALDENESKGTQKAFHLSGPILRTLAEGGVLVIDEIEAKMHPIMTINTINLFLNKETNPKNAQIIFATHDTNLLTYSNLRRDQINFVEKNKWEATEIYSLSDFKYFGETNQIGETSPPKYSERIDADKEKRYLEGRYGAIPMINKVK